MKGPETAGNSFTYTIPARPSRDDNRLPVKVMRRAILLDGNAAS
jgi:hypothetical protein